ncbi:hypothetical protein V6N13_136672 [Hibiscus sabdariffa]
MAKLFTFPSLIISLFLFSFNALATVPPSATFKHVNNGEFGPFVVEYLGNYRVISIANAPFQLAFYNTTPNAFTLALRMASTRSESLFRWVWEAKRGNPTNTANRGVVGFKLLSNGNMVLHDSKGKFIWQSFDHPTDTLLVGQSLRIGGPTKLVSRASAQNNVDGAYSLVMEPKGLVLQYKGLNSPKPLVYFKSSVRPSTQDGTLQTVTLNVEPDTHEGFAYNVVLDYTVAKSSSGGTGNLILARPKYNRTPHGARNANCPSDVGALGFVKRTNASAARCGRDYWVGTRIVSRRRETSKCWVANELKTLAKTSNTSHVGYIKAPKK